MFDINHFQKKNLSSVKIYQHRFDSRFNHLDKYVVEIDKAIKHRGVNNNATKWVAKVDDIKKINIHTVILKKGKKWKEAQGSGFC